MGMGRERAGGLAVMTDLGPRKLCQIWLHLLYLPESWWERACVSVHLSTKPWCIILLPQLFRAPVRDWYYANIFKYLGEELQTNFIANCRVWLETLRIKDLEIAIIRFLNSSFINIFSDVSESMIFFMEKWTDRDIYFYNSYSFSMNSFSYFSVGCFCLLVCLPCFPLSYY